MSEDRTRHVLARITNNRDLARAVPLLPPEALHAVIVHQGLHDSAELIALATAEQLSAVLDLDLWKARKAGGDEQFDADRFCEWMEVLLDAGTGAGAARLAAIDVSLVVAGLSPSITVMDLAVFSPAVESSGADPVVNAGRERGLHAEIGGYLVVSRRPDVWEAIVEMLLALEEQYPDTFQQVMRACRTLSNSGWELDRLDDLLPDADQLRFDLSLGREQRRDRLGFVTPERARAFLHAARHVSLMEEPPGGERSSPCRSDHALQRSTESADADWVEREQEFAFIANALVAGCSVQGRPFTRREAIDAVAATCSLGLAHWPGHWAEARRRSLNTVFQVGWAIMHRDVSMAVAGRLIAVLSDMQVTDQDMQFGLHALRRELQKQWQAGTPWRARGRLDVLATLDLPAWAALAALLDECPVMLANVCVRGDRPLYTVNPSEFQFIADATHIAAVHRFLLALPAALS